MIKIHKYDIGYTQVLNKVLNDNGLSLEAKGIYAYLSSKSQTNQSNLNYDIMYKELKETKKVIDEAIDELVKKGYLNKEVVLC
jgi:hypothetical protein